MKYELHIPLRTMLVLLIAVPQFFGRGNYVQASASLLLFVGIFLIIFRCAKRYAKKKYWASEWFGQGDIYMSWAIALLVPFILQQHYLNFSRWILSKIVLLFIIMSCLLGIVFRLSIHVIKRRTPNMRINTVSPLFRDKILIPFIPAMIVAFRLLLRKADLFIPLCFPW